MITFICPANGNRLSRPLIFLLCLGMMAMLNACASPEEKRDEFYSRAVKKYERGDYQEAAVEVKNAIKIDGNHAPSFLLLARCELRDQQFQNAFNHLRKAVEIDPGFNEARVMLGRVYFAAGENDQARHAADTVLENDPDNLEAIMTIASIRLREQKFSQAQDDLENVIGKDPSNQEAYMLLSQALEKTGGPEAAVAILNKGLEHVQEGSDIRIRLIRLYAVLNQYDAAEEQFEKLLSTNPDSVALRLLRVKFYQETGQDDKIENELRHLVRAFPAEAQYRLALAQILLNRQEFQAAEEVLKAAIQELKNNYDLRLALGDLYRLHDRIEEAVRVYNETANLDKFNPEGLNARRRLARMYLEQNEMDMAQAELDTIFARNQQDLEAHLLQGRIYLNQGNAARAISALRQVVKDQPELLAAHTLLAMAHFQNEEPQIAVQTLRDALKNAPDFDEARNLLIQYYLRRGQYDAAVGHLQVLHQHHPEDPAITAGLGDAYAYNRKYDDAEKIFQELSRTDEGRMHGEIKLGQLALLRKNYSSAGEHFKKALAYQPDSAEAMEGYIRSLVSTDRNEKALEEVRGFLRQNPESAFLHDLLARVELIGGNFHAAEEALLKATRCEPKWLPPYYRIGALYLQTGRVDEGIAKFGEALKNNPDSLQTAFILGILYQQNNNTRKARITYQDILAKNPDFLPAANNLAYLMAEESSDPEELKRAMELAERAATAEDPSATVLDTVGWIYYKLGNTDRALKYLNDARGKDRDNPTIAYHLATVLSETDSLHEAERILSRDFRTDLPFPEKEQADALLKKLREKLGKS